MSNYQDTCTALGICVMANQPVILWGPPGQGKTSVLNAMSKTYSMMMETVIASIRDPSDFAGLPVVDANTGTVRLAPPGWAQRCADHDGPCIVFYDELSTATPAVQAAMLRPVLENAVGDLTMPESVRTVAAANPADMAAGGWELAPPMANRFVHLQWSLPADVVRDGFSVGWPEVTLPMPDEEIVEQATRDALILVGAFIGARTEIVTKMPDSSDESGYAFPTPRSWEMAGKLYGYAIASGVDSNVIQMLLSGTVGVAAAGEFIAFVADLDLPDPEKLIADPDSFVVPTDRGDKVYAISASVYAALSNNTVTKERWIACGDIFAKIADADQADIAYTYGVRWQKLRPEGALPTKMAVTALMPILVELREIIGAA